MLEQSVQTLTTESGNENHFVTNTELKHFYDATASQRYEYIVEENGEEFETAHVFHSEFNDDVLYLAWINGWNIKTKSDGEAEEKYSEKTCEFWDSCIDAVENFELGNNWKSKISADEKLEAISNLLAVAIATTRAKAKVRGGSTEVSETQTVLTEAYFNGTKAENIVQQLHILTNKNRDEFRKKYNRIQAKRFKEEKVGGLRKKPAIQFIPQDEAIGKLYDEMMIETKGFVENIVPLRFKTTVIHHIFGTKLDAKK